MSTLGMSRRQVLGQLAALAATPGLVACDAAAPTRAGDEPGTRRSGIEPVRRAKRAARIVPAVTMNEGQGAVVQRIFPTPHIRHLDPFVLLDDFSVAPPAGFPRHPHRGFEAFTYMIDGSFHHRDNLGNDSVIDAGGTQRFTSGRGAYHSEMPAGAGQNQGLQLWVNLPRRLKRMDPSYRGTAPPDIPERTVPRGRVRAVVGASGASTSPVDLQTEVKYLDVVLEGGARFGEVVQDGFNALVYVMQGRVRALGNVIERGQALLPDAGPLEIQALEAARVVLLVGRPHGEPIHHRGPFVD